MLKSIAWGLSVVFHPLLITSYMLLLLLMINPYLFGVSSVQDEHARLLLLLVFLYTFFLPAVFVVVMYFLGMVESLSMPDKQERIVPYLFTGMLYIWVYYNFLKNGQMPPAYISFMLGTIVALFLAFIINIFSKISIHAVGMGGIVGMLLISFFFFSYGTFTLDMRGSEPLEVSILHVLMVALVLAGAVGTARLLLKAHEPGDVYGGYFIGFSAQLLGFMYIF